MIAKIKSVFVYFLVVTIFTGCYNIVGGNRGARTYVVVKSNNIYFDFTTNTLHLSDTSKTDDLSVQVYTDGMFMYKSNTNKNSSKSFYKFEDSFFDSYHNNVIEIMAIAEHDKFYTLKIFPGDWIKKEIVYGYFRKY